MTTILVDVQLGRHADFSQSQIKQHAILRGHAGIRGRVKEKSWRRLRRYLLFRRKALHQLRVRLIAEEISERATMDKRRCKRDDGVSEHQEIRPAAVPFNRIARIRAALIEMRTCGGGKVPARGKAPNAKVVGRDTVLLGMQSNKAQRALCILERRWVMISRSQPVLQDKCGHAEGIQPAGNLIAFMIHSQMGVAAAGTNHNTGVGSARRFGQINRQARPI